MAVKYECPKCGRKFTEWGAEKLNFHCPVDEWCAKDASEDIQLVKAGSAEAGAKAPSLKRRPKKVAAVPVREEEEAIVPDVDDVDEDIDEEIEDEEEIEEVEVEDEEEVVVAKKKTTDDVDDPDIVVADDAEVGDADVEDLDFDEDADADDADAEVTEEEEWS